MHRKPVHPMLAAASVTSTPARTDHRLPGSSRGCFGAIKPDRCWGVRDGPSAGAVVVPAAISSRAWQSTSRLAGWIAELPILAGRRLPLA